MSNMIRLSLTNVAAFSLALVFSVTASAGMLDTGATYDMMSNTDTRSYSMDVDGMNVTVTASEDWSSYSVDFGEQIMLETVSTQSLAAMDAGDGRRWTIGGAYGADKMHYMNLKTRTVTFDKVAFDNFAPTNLTFSRTIDPPTTAPIPEPMSAVLFPVGLGIVGWAMFRRRSES